jgi:hypothetical protein
MNFIPFDLNELPEAEKKEALRKHAIGIVLQYCAEQPMKTDDGKPYRASHTIQQVRNHFNTTKWSEAAAQLGVSFDALIDEHIKLHVIMVTNGFVWVRNVEGK